MKKSDFFKVVLIALAMAVMAPLGVRAQSPVKFGFTSESGNLWFTPISGITSLVNSIIGSTGTSGYYNVSWFDMEDTTGADVDVKSGNFFGFRATDMFNQFGVGVRMAYEPYESPVGAYVTAMYKYRQFRMSYAPVSSVYEKYQACLWNVSLGVNIAPFTEMFEYDDWSPMIQVQESYNKVFNARAPFANDLDQFGSGFRTRLGQTINIDAYGAAASLIHYETSYDITRSDAFDSVDVCLGRHGGTKSLLSGRHLREERR